MRCGGFATLASPPFRSHQPSAWASVLTPNNLTLHKSLDAPDVGGNLPRLQISGRAGGPEGQ
jgi:hypothetical protein